MKAVDRFQPPTHHVPYPIFELPRKLEGLSLFLCSDQGGYSGGGGGYNNQQRGGGGGWGGPPQQGFGGPQQFNNQGQGFAMNSRYNTFHVLV